MKTAWQFSQRFVLAFSFLAGLCSVLHAQDGEGSPSDPPSVPRLSPDDEPPAPSVFSSEEPTPAAPEVAPAVEPPIDEPRQEQPSTAANEAAPAAEPLPALPILKPAPAAEVEVEIIPANDPEVVEASPPAATAKSTKEMIDAPAQIRIELKATVFQNVEPGATTLDELKKHWGQPRRETVRGNTTTYSFLQKPYSRVDAVVRGGKVTSLYLHLRNPAAPDMLANQLSLQGFTPVSVANAAGEVLGRSYPERGVTFSFAADREAAMVSYILLEPISAEPFVLRATTARGSDWQAKLIDLDIAQQLDPADADVFAARAETLYRVGAHHKALQQIDQAIQLSPEVAVFRLTKAKVLGDLRRASEGVKLVATVLKETDTTNVDKAQAYCLGGNLTAKLPSRDYAKALTYHQKAIELASEEANSETASVRRAAKHILFEAHLAVAGDVAGGKWQNKEKTVKQWLDRSQAFADELVSSGDGDPSLQLVALCGRVKCLTALEEKIDPTSLVKKTQTVAEDLMKKSEDELFHRYVQSQLAAALVDGVQIECKRKSTETCLAWAQEAEALLLLASPEAEQDDTRDDLKGRLYFLIGSVQAVQKKDHVAAAAAYAKAVDYFAYPEPDADLTWTAERGQCLVSMGVSFWEAGDREEALKLTEQGVRLVELVVADKAVGKETLAVPYSNLSLMYRAIGDEQQAQNFAEMASKLEAAKIQR